MPWWDLHDRMLERHMGAFGEAVTLFPLGGGSVGVPLRGIFDTPPERADLNLLRDLSNQAPWVDFRVLELPDTELPEQGSQLEIRGARWEVVDVAPDGGGQVRCRLFRVGPGSTAPLPLLAAPAV